MDRRLKLVLSIPFFFWLFLFILGPLVWILVISFSQRDLFGQVMPVYDPVAYKTLFDPLYFEVLLRTLVMAFANTALTLLVSFPLAYWISRMTPQRKNTALILILIPFWTNFLIRILAFMDVLRMHPFGFDLLYNFGGILACLVYNYLPCAVLPIYSSLEKIDRSVIEAGRDLGASWYHILFRILLPLARGGITAAAIFVFIPTLGEFLIPDLVGGGRFFTLGTFLQNQFLTARNWPLGSATVVLLVILTLLILLFRRKKAGSAEVWV